MVRVEVRIEKVVEGGAGLARTSEGVVLVPLALPGERVRLESIERRGGVARARLAEILEAHPRRVPPGCPIFGTCGGCDLRHAAYDLELELKRETVRETLARVGGVAAEVAPVLAAPRPGAYRNHAKLHVSHDRSRIGFHAAETSRVIDVPACPLLRPEVAAAYAGLRARGTDADVMTIRTDLERTIVREDRPGRRAPLPEPLQMPLGGRRFRTSWMSFFQVHFEVAETLAARVRDLAGEGDLLLDAYAGVGVFALLLAPRFRRAAALEVSRHAVEDARANGAETIRHDAALGLPDLGGRPDAVVLDPPRTGLTPPLLRDLLALRVPRLVYVSCAVPTLARDLAALLAGGYRLEGPVEPLDMFPRTAHVECVAALSLR